MLSDIRSSSRRRWLLGAAGLTAVALVLALGMLDGAIVAATQDGQAVSSEGDAQLGLPDSPRNLQVLPADMSTRAVVGVMRGFSMALDVRCIHCHLGDAPRDLDTVDFASDERPTKRKARVMMRMVQAINDTHLVQLTTLGSDPESLLQVSCVTCHHGQSRPLTLQNVLKDAFDKGGIEQTLSEYDGLRDRYYGGWTYDFGEGSLLDLAGQLAQSGDVDAATALIDKNLEIFPESFASHATRGRILETAGDIEGAKAAFQACLSVNPQAGFCQRQLDELSQ